MQSTTYSVHVLMVPLILAHEPSHHNFQLMVGIDLPLYYHRSLRSSSSTADYGAIGLIVILYGLFSYFLLLFWAATRPSMRLRTYQMIGHSLSMFVGVLIYQTVDEIANEIFASLRAELIVSIIVFLIWTTCWVLLISSAYAKPLKQQGCLVIGGHITGFACINVMIHIQSDESFSQSRRYAVLFLVLSFLVLVIFYILSFFLTESLYIMLVNGVRKLVWKIQRKRNPEISSDERPTLETFLHRLWCPPAHAEGAILKFMVHVVASVDLAQWGLRSIGFSSVNLPYVQAFGGTQSYLTVQACAYMIYKVYPGASLMPPQRGQFGVWMMGCWAVFFLLLVLLVNLITMYPKARNFITHGKWWADMYFDGVHKFSNTLPLWGPADSSEPLKSPLIAPTLVLTFLYCHLSLAWSSLLFTYWILAVFYPNGTPQTIWAITNSILYSLMSIPLLALLTFTERKFHIPTEIVQGFIWALSLVVGYSWKLVFTDVQNSVLTSSTWFIRILTAIMLFCLMIPIYFHLILPRMNPNLIYHDEGVQVSEDELLVYLSKRASTADSAAIGPQNNGPE